MEAVIVDSSSPPSVKRMRLSPRVNSSLTIAIPTKLDTPVVKRKTPRGRDGVEERKVVTPHSILKVVDCLFKRSGLFYNHYFR